MPETNVRTWPNPDCRTYSARVELCDKYESAQRGFTNPESEILRLIWTIPGIQGLSARGYELQLVRTPAFGWEEIEPRVLELLNALEVKEPQ